MKRRNTKKYALTVLILILAVLSYKNYTSTPNDTRDIGLSKQSVVEELSEIKRYYVAVARLDSKKEDITKEELKTVIKEGKDLILAKDVGEVGKFFDVEIKGSVESIDKLTLENGVGVLRVDDLTPKYKVLDFEGKSIWKDADYSLFVHADKEKDELEFDRSQVVTLTSVGDIMLSRNVYTKSKQLGYLSPFAKVSDKLKSADITFGNLETSISDLATPPTAGMSFVAPTKSMEGVNSAGFDILNLANNHSTNFGLKIYSDLLQVLKANKIVYVGGGENSSEAKSYKTFESKGKKFAFIGVNSIVGDVAAGDNSPGNWKISLSPWGSLDQGEVDELVAEIKKAKSENDYVIIMPHWGTEYTHDPNAEMKDLGHQIMDAGADLIVGTHPHWTQGIEIYKNKLITYSLGNFVFDQEWSQETKEGIILDTVFYNGRLVSSEISPVLISDYHQPSIASGGVGDKILNDVWASSMKIDPGF